MIQPTSTNCPVSGQEEMNAVKKTTSQTSWFCLSLTRCSRVQTSFCWSASSTLPCHSSPSLPAAGCAPLASPYSCFPGSGLHKKIWTCFLLLSGPFRGGGGRERKQWNLFWFHTNVPVGLLVNYMVFGDWFFWRHRFVKNSSCLFKDLMDPVGHRTLWFGVHKTLWFGVSPTKRKEPAALCYWVPTARRVLGKGHIMVYICSNMFTK